MKTRPRLYRNGLIAREDETDLQPADVLVRGRTIQNVERSLPAPDDAEMIECQGKILVPGLFDVHVHLRRPETMESLAAAAIHGGITGVLVMPDLNPPTDSGNLVTALLESASDAPVRICVAGCVTKERKGERMADIAGLNEAGAVLLTDADDPVADPLLLRRSMEYARSFGLPFASHCQIAGFSPGGVMNEGGESYRAGQPGMAPVSEDIAVYRDGRLAEDAGVRLHAQQLSTGAALNTVRRLKSEGIPISCEVSPHHLLFSDGDAGDYDTLYKTNPPLRSRENCRQLLEGLLDGTVDLIASDHLPVTDFEKNRDFGSAPFGISGLETALISLYHHFVKKNLFGWDLIVRRYSAEPRRLVGLKPLVIASRQPAEFFVFDPETETTITSDFMRSNARNTPFFGQTLSGGVVSVEANGKNDWI